MDFSKMSLQDMMKPYSLAAMAARDTFLSEFEGFAILYEILESEKLPGGRDVLAILQYCVELFPYICNQGCGTLKGEDFVDSDNKAVTKEYTLLELWCRSHSSAKLIYALQNLCVLLDIYPPYCFRPLIEACQGRVKLGSGIDMESLEWTVCANWAVQQPKFCLNLATKQCTRCKLVAYCSSECQLENWDYHKLVCKRRKPDEASGSETIVERKPGEVRVSETSEELAEEGIATLDHRVVWDRVPAFGLLGDCPPFQEGETRELPTPLRLCFDDCFDLNNVIETICQISGDYKGEVMMYINCSNRQAVARNMIICYILVQLADAAVDTSAIDAAIAVWYSAYLTPFQFLYIVETIRSILVVFNSLLPTKYRALFDGVFATEGQKMEVMHKTLDKLAETFDIADADGSIFDGGTGSGIRVRLSGFHICKYLYAMQFLPWDSKDLHLTRQTSLCKFDSSAKLDEFLLDPHEQALARFRHCGVLLPFSQFSGHYTLPNPTLFQGIPVPQAAWTVESNACDPLSGWPIDKVLQSTSGPPHHVPANDIYGNLYFYVRDQLITAVKRMRSFRITFVLSDKSTELFLRDLRHKSPGMLSIYRAMVKNPPIGRGPTEWNLLKFLQSWAPLFTRRGDETLVIRREPHTVGSHDEEAIESALTAFDVFLSRFPDENEFASNLRKYRAAIGEARVDIDRLSPMFLNDVTYLMKCYLELEQELKANITSAAGSSDPSLPPAALSRRTEHLASPSRPVTVAVGLVLDEEQGAQPAVDKKLKDKGKRPMAELEATMAAAAARRSDSYKTGIVVTSAETCYCTVMLTMLNQLTTFFEWSVGSPSDAFKMVHS